MTHKASATDEKFMRRCLQLAQNGLCNTAPNPMVGAVIVCNGRIIGEGYHVHYGEAHAEVNAIHSVAALSVLKRATIYVSLEPCAHYGKTSPCADLLVETGIPRIVIGCRDPFAKVAGRGIQKLKDAGREVIVGVLEEECRHLIRRFITFHTCKRPYVTLKWAQSADGYMDWKRTGGHSAKLSNPYTAMLVHKLRAEHSAIMVGTNTARLDNPRLDVRHWYGRPPVRIVTDCNLALPASLHLFDGSIPTLVFTAKQHEDLPGIEYITADYSRSLLPQLLTQLHARNLQSLLVEGGSQLLQSFIEAGIWDEIWIEESPVLLGGGIKAPQLQAGNVCHTKQVFGHTFRYYVPGR